MTTNYKILIIGFGSIGERHYKNLKSLGFDNIHIYDPDENKISGQKLKIKNLDKKTLSGFDIAFICSPNHKHIETAIICAKAGLQLFIEKPLSHNLKDIAKLKKISQDKKLINMVACNMRFHPALAFIKRYLAGGRLGRVYSISHEFGYYLPKWRPGTDYRQNYAAKKSLGGGIVLDDIHEFDLLFWLNDFSPVAQFCLLKNNSRELQIETEDVAKAVFKFKNGVLGSVAADYLSQAYHRSCLIVGQKGNLVWDWGSGQVTLITEQRSKTVYTLSPSWTANLMYIAEIKYFLESVNKQRETFNDIKTATDVLKYCL